MNPFEENPLWDEIRRLRGEIADLNDTHQAAVARISARISGLESAFVRSVVNVVGPPPLPEPAMVPEPPVAVPEEVVEEPPVLHAVAPSPPPVPAPVGNHRFELDFGKVWFVRIGVVILLTGLVFLGNYAYQNWVREMPNGIRLAALFGCALVLVETGRRLANKESLNRFGEVLMAGGMAFFYYCTFAAHHVTRLRVIESPAVGAVLLSAAAFAIAAVSWRREAKTTAVLGIVLASYATMLQPIGWMSCLSNVLLGGLGLFFMLRPAWSAAGWASMLGSYGAFLGWQLFGASGGNTRVDDPATLWFLPPLWVMFAIPGALDRFRESLSDRARAWFTASNNALFFLLFSAVWSEQNGSDSYWKVAGFFGFILIMLGILGRRRQTTAGGVNIGQGIAVATLALILKLDGQHLGLVLAFESLALALAALRYGGKCESVFSLLCGLGAAWIVISEEAAISIASVALTASLVAGASVVSERGAGKCHAFAEFRRASAFLLFAAAVIVVSQLCVVRLEDSWRLVTSVLLAGGLTVVSLKLDVKRRQPEVLWASLWFLGLAVLFGFGVLSKWPLALAAVVALLACWFWHHRGKGGRSAHDPAAYPDLCALVFSAPVPIFLWLFCQKWAGGFWFSPTRVDLALGLNQVAACALVPTALAVRCPKLVTMAGIYSCAALGYWVLLPAGNAPVIFGAFVLAGGSAAVVLSSWGKSVVSENPPRSGGLFRFSAFGAYCAAWHAVVPGAWMDCLAITSIGLVILSVVIKRKIAIECLGFLAISFLGLAFEMFTSPWMKSEMGDSWRGILVVFALLGLTFTYRERPALIADPQVRKSAIAVLAGLACLVATLWATQMLVWRFGWKPTAVLWTLLGFGFVSAGLWQGLHILRVCGFGLLLVSFCKLFAVDVWDFTAFMRVVSFIVLGAALILLGLFYNNFSETIKALLDSEQEAKPTGNRTGEEAG
jgi:uncharacterized membrane protein